VVTAWPDGILIFVERRSNNRPARVDAHSFSGVIIVCGQLRRAGKALSLLTPTAIVITAQ
jgi:hypothetical protein